MLNLETYIEVSALTVFSCKAGESPNLLAIICENIMIIIYNTHGCYEDQMKLVQRKCFSKSYPREGIMSTKGMDKNGVAHATIIGQVFEVEHPRAQ